MDRLASGEWITHDRAPPGRRGWQSSVSPKPRLIERAGGFITVPCWRVREPIVLRSRNSDGGGLLDYADTDRLHRMRHGARAQNEVLAGVTISGAPGATAQLRRIYTGNFTLGGRFYAEGGAWQTLPKAERLALTLDDEPVVEIDYCELHPRLAYARCGLDYPGGAYDLQGLPRPLVKIAMSILFNSSDENGARYTLSRKPAFLQWLEPNLFELATGETQRVRTQSLLSEDRADGAAETAPWQAMLALKPGIGCVARDAAADLIERLLIKHDGIRSMFFCGAGLRLKREDGDIADRIMRTLRRKGAVALPVHDSFLIKARQAPLLEGAMTEAVHGYSGAFTFRASLPEEAE